MLAERRHVWVVDAEPKTCWKQTMGSDAVVLETDPALHHAARCSTSISTTYNRVEYSAYIYSKYSWRQNKQSVCMSSRRYRHAESDYVVIRDVPAKLPTRQEEPDCRAGKSCA